MPRDILVKLYSTTIFHYPINTVKAYSTCLHFNGVITACLHWDRLSLSEDKGSLGITILSPNYVTIKF